MILKLHPLKIQTLDDVRAFLADTARLDFISPARDERNSWVENTLRHLTYRRLGKADRGAVIRCLVKATGLSRSQVKKLIKQFLDTGKVKDRRGHPGNAFRRIYTAQDVALLVETDRLHGTLSGPTTRKLFERAFQVFGKERYKRLAAISNGQLYNLRHSKGYQRQRHTADKTRPATPPIGVRRKPEPKGRPGFLRIDTVHPGSRDGDKGLYIVNAVDEVLQWQGVICVPRISENFLIPALEDLLDALPLVIRGFHSDNGSEFINRQVAGRLNKLHIEHTKSRPRRSNDNALVESKNGSTVRRHLGHGFIPSEHTRRGNDFTLGWLSRYLNFHHPCYFPEVVMDDKGRQRKTYPYRCMMTPYEKLRSLPDAQSHLKPGITLDKLDEIAMQFSDNEAAKRLNEARAKLFRSINPTPKPTAWRP